MESGGAVSGLERVIFTEVGQVGASSPETRKRPQLSRFGWGAVTLAGLLAVARPPAVQAHGELLIRIAELTRQLEAAPTNRAALYLARGELHRQHQSWEEAESDYASAAQLDPDLPAVDFCRARLLADSGQLETARALFEKGLARCPTDGEAFIGRARVLMRLGHRQPAVADYRRGLELLRQPAPEYFLELAQALADGGQASEALQCLDEGISRCGFFVALQSYALELELDQKKHDAALARLETLLERATRKESWLARRGDILLAAGRPTDARKSFEAALAAVKTVPLRLQQGPTMMNLLSQINAALAGIARAAAAGNPPPP
jgi:tetratricopeptide (TPR) repeat protein